MEINERVMLSSQLATMDPETRTVEAVFYSGTPVVRTPFFSGPYELQFSCDPKHVSMARLANGAFPVVLDHSGSIRDTIGVVTAASVDGRSFVGTIQFDADLPAEIWNPIKNGTWRNISMGATLNAKPEDISEKGAAMKRYLATDWEPYHVSLVSDPADPNAVLLSQQSVTEVLGAPAPQSEEKEFPNMETQTQGQPANPVVNLEAERNAATLAERSRVSDINAIGQRAKLSAERIAQAINSNETVELFRAAAFEELAARSNATPTLPGNPAASVVRDETDTRRELMSAAMLNRINPTKHTTDSQNDFRHMSCMEMAKESLSRAGRSVRGRDRNEIAMLAMQNSADFANVLENSMRKVLMSRYEIQQPTYRIWAKASTTPDFKTMSRSRLSEAPTFLKVPEGGQVTIGTMSDTKETYALATYGRGVSFTRQMLINDDLGAFTDIWSRFGDQAAILENKTVYSILTANAALSDTVALFHASHANLGTGVIADAGLDAGFTAMGIQTGLDATSVLNIEPKFIIVPKAKYSTAQRYMLPTNEAVKGSDKNIFAGRLTIVADGVLDATSTIVWYLAADPAMYPGVEYAHLEGANGPQMVRQENEDGVLGVQLYAFLDFGAKAVDFRPLYKSSGS